MSLDRNNLFYLSIVTAFFGVFYGGCQRSKSTSYRTAQFTPHETPDPQAPTQGPVSEVEPPSQFDLANADALALVEYIPGVSYLDDDDRLLDILAGSTEPQVVLAKIDFFGRLIYAGHPAVGGPKATTLTSLPPHGHLLTFGSAKGTSNLAMISNSWTEILLKDNVESGEKPFIAKKFEYSARQVLRVVDENGKLLVLNPINSESSLVNDPLILKKTIFAENVVSTSEGDVFVGASEGKVFHLKSDSLVSGFAEQTAIPTLTDGFAVDVRVFVGNRSYRVSSGAIFYSLLPHALRPALGTNNNVRLLANAWGLAESSAGLFAVNLLSSKIVGNPFGDDGVLRSIRLDSATGAFFDGFNIATVGASADRLAMMQVGKLAFPVASNMKIRRLFGIDNGFVESFFAFAESEGILYWVPVDKTTGLVNKETAVVWTLDSNSGTLDEFVKNTSAYKVGDKIILLRNSSGTGIAEAQFPPTGGALVLRVIDVGVDIVIRHDLGFLESTNNLVFATGDNDIILSYDVNTDLVVNRAQPAFNLLADETLCVRRIFGVVPKSSTQSTGVLARFCPGNEILAIVEFADNTFSVPGTVLNLGFPKVGTKDPVEDLIVMRDQNGQVLLVGKGASEIVVVSANLATLVKRLPVSALVTEGLFKLSDEFDAIQPRPLLVIPWIGTKVIVNGKKNGKFVSQVVDLGTRTKLPLPQLDDFSIEHAGLARSKRLVMDALDGLNTRVIIRLELNDSVSGVDRNYGVSFVDIAPF